MLAFPAGKTRAMRLASSGPTSRCVTKSTTNDMLGKVLTSPAQLGPATYSTLQSNNT